jgi:HAD superfamily hydrolase (TIGR01509 family)
MLKTIIFDFDGVIANSEPAHFITFQKVLSEEGVSISQTDYFKRYLAMDDRGAFTTALTDFGKPSDPIYISELIFRKSSYFEHYLKEEMSVYPNTLDFINQVKTRFPLAINSGALRAEIDSVLIRFGLIDVFPLIISSENVTKCKPDPEGYLKALACLNKMHPSLDASPKNCLVIEDSVGGIKSAISAGMKCIAVTNTYPKEALGEATFVVSSLTDLTDSLLNKFFE